MDGGLKMQPWMFQILIKTRNNQILFLQMVI